MKPAPIILFGAFDRHNFGDLLLAHVAAAELGSRPRVFAGVAERDLRPWGGHAVRAIAALGREWDDRPAQVHHVGGELLACSLYEAAVMVLDPVSAAAAIARYDARPLQRQAWAEAQLGLRRQLAYLPPKTLFHNPGRFSYAALGGVNLPSLSAEQQAEIRSTLLAADQISVRDRVTQGHLAAWGIQAALAPDPGEQVARLFGGRIARHGARGEPAALRARFPQGYLALQFSADYGDDATLRTLAAQLDRVARETGLGICLFRAGAAPWHDDVAVYRRFMGFLRSEHVCLFASLHLWDICALLAQARIYCGSSLHGRIVARAFGVPGINLVRSSAPQTHKVQAYWHTWWHTEDAPPVTPGAAHGALLAALANQ